MARRAVLFDLDGTLVDSLPGIEFSIDCALIECGAPRRECDLAPLIGPPIRTILAQIVPDLDAQQLSQLEHAFRKSYNFEGWRKTAVHSGAIDTVAKLRGAGLEVFLVTNKPEAPTHQILDAFRMNGLFTDVICRDSRTPPFPSKGEMLRHVISCYRLEPAACVYVGDSLEDYEAAMAAGVSVALVSHGYGATGPDLLSKSRNRDAGSSAPSEGERSYLPVSQRASATFALGSCITLNKLTDVLNLAGISEAA